MFGQTAPRRGRSCLGVVVSSIVWVLFLFPAVAQSSSNVRIVRLSFVEGTVKVLSPGVTQWAKGFVNTPIQQGFKLATDANSFAEVEFENGSVARLGENSILDFTELSLGSAGNKINRMSLSHGYATFTVLPERDDLYQVNTPDGTFTANGKSTFRVDLGRNDLRLEVFKGHVRAESPYGRGTVAANHVLDILPGNSDAYRVSRGITLDAWDKWVKQRSEETTVAMNSPGYQSASAYGSPYSSLYGWNQLYYYGNWNYLPGFGYGWTPYAAIGWTPFSYGQWAFYPGFGYTWISGLPWGWLPFHYGNWVDVIGYGWSWMPGNFGAWSPGVVNWYQGAGWVGWYPYPGRYRTHGYIGCQAGMNCATSVSLTTFQSGGAITPSTIERLDPAQSRIVSSPTVTPTRFVRLPGPAVSEPRVLYGSEQARTFTAGRIRAPKATVPRDGTLVRRTFVAGDAPSTVHSNLPSGFQFRNPRGIVFNPATQQYENSSASPGAMMSTEKQMRGKRDNAGGQVMMPGSMGGNERGGIQRSTNRARGSSNREGFNRRLSPSVQGNSSRPSREMNNTRGAPEPRMQRSAQPSGKPGHRRDNGALSGTFHAGARPDGRWNGRRHAGAPRRWGRCAGASPLGWLCSVRKSESSEAALLQSPTMR
ncbi:MAG TPA: FecR family protein [Terriglobia bacterium]|nr:FecR family protein [Terriglobia bacterium]